MSVTTRQALWLAGLAVLPTLLFLDAAVSIDAPVFLAVSRQILRAPLDPFGFEMVWDPTSPQAAEFNLNPPLLSYLLAPVIAWLGEWEPALHATLAPLPVLTAACFAGIARRLAGQGFAPALLLVATPAFALLGTTLMLDVPVLAAFLAAVYALLRSNETEGARWEWVAGVAAAAAGLTKYVGLSILPLLVAGLWLLPASGDPARRRRPGRWLRVLGIPLAVWGGWAVWTQQLYGAVHFAGGVALAGQRSVSPDEFWNHLASVPVFYGAALVFPMLACLRSLLRAQRGAELAVAGLVAGAAVVAWVLPDGAPPRRVELGAEEAVLGALGFAGALWVWGLGLVGEPGAWRTPEHRFLALWLLGFMAFSMGVNWHVNAADALMAAPPALLLWFRRAPLLPASRTLALWAALAFLLSLVLTASDVAQRNVYREVAARIVREIGDAPGRRWFVGHWGLQYYLERESFQPVAPSQYARRFGRSRLEVGDWVVSSRNVSQLDVTRAMAPYGMRVVWRWELPAAIPLRATNPDAGAGFYSHQSGHVPFAWSRVPLEEVGLARVTAAADP